MKQLISFFILITIGTIGYSQPINWKETRNWKIYALNKNEAFYYPADTLSTIKSVRMNDSMVISFLSHSSILPKHMSPNWMGLYIASYETADKQTRKVVISSYGGFIFESALKRYYELPAEVRDLWNDYILSNLKKVFEE